MITNESGIPRRVLIVDDDELVRDSIGGLLRAADYEVATAGDGMQALTLLGRQWFPVVVTDREMPLLDGVEFVQRLRAIAVAPIYTIMLTASTDAQDYERGYCAGVDHYIHKKGYETELLGKVSGGFRAIKRRQHTSGARGNGPIIVDLENGAHTARHLIGRLSAEMAHAAHSGQELSVVSVCIEPAPGPANTALASAAADALLQAALSALRPGLDWVARLPSGSVACRLAVVMPLATVAEVAAFEQGVRNALVGASERPALRAARLTFGAAAPDKDGSKPTALGLLGDAERRRRGVESTPRGDLGAVQGEAA